MKYRQLGNTGLLVSEIALGTMIFGEDSQRGVSPDVAERITHRFLDVGGNHIDTANVYGRGRSEEVVGRAIKDRRQQVFLATKVRFAMGDGPNDGGLSRYHVMQKVDDSLRRLQVDTIDLLYMHSWDHLTPLDESLRAFDDMVSAGKVRYIGVSNFKAWQMMKGLGLSDTSGWARFVAAQYQYSLVVRDIEGEFLDLCESEKVGVVPWGALGGGFLSGKYRREQRPSDPSEGRLATTPDEYEESWKNRSTERNWEILAVMDEIASSYGATHSQIALAWLLTRPAVASVLVGARTMAQLDDNLAALELDLPVEEVSRLNGVSEVPLSYPYRFQKSFTRKTDF